MNRTIADFIVAAGLGASLVTLILNPWIGIVVTLVTIITAIVLARKGY